MAKKAVLSLAVVLIILTIVMVILYSQLLAQEHASKSIRSTMHTGMQENEDSSSSFMQSHLDEIDMRPEIWARGAPETVTPIMSQAKSLLSQQQVGELRGLCVRCLYHTLHHALTVTGIGDDGFVQTGDIPLMWIRDGAIQLGIYLPRIKKHPAIRYFLEGSIRRLAFLILQDPYANSFQQYYRDPKSTLQSEAHLGRGGWVGTRNYELDSGAYFMNLIWNYYTTEGLYQPQQFIQERLIFDAVNFMVDTWIVEQTHYIYSSYLYVELPNNGSGDPVGYTGMTWSGYRPSDDPQKYGYHIPGNFYAAGALQRMLLLNKNIWKNQAFEKKTTKLLKDIELGLKKFGFDDKDGDEVYVYEVDGFGGSFFFDDPNVPSLLSLPLLGYEKYDKITYQKTREKLLDPQFNEYFYQGQILRGQGSPHTPAGFVWPIGLIVQALTSQDPAEIADIVSQVLQTQCGNGLMHESVHASQVSNCTRDWFEWANIMVVVLTENLLGKDCEDYIKYNGDAKYYTYIEAMVRQVPGQPYLNFLAQSAYNAVESTLLRLGALPPKEVWGKWMMSETDPENQNQEQSLQKQQLSQHQQQQQDTSQER